MKKLFYKLTLILSLSLILFSCTSTLQEDVFVSTELSAQILESIAEYENEFIEYDSCKTLNIQLSDDTLLQFEDKLAKELENPYLEPAVNARLNAFFGLVELFRNKKNSAINHYEKAKAMQAGDDYVIILGIRLSKTQDQVSAIDEFLLKDPDNSILMLEKAKILYTQGLFDQSLATIDSAFLIFDREERNYYRTVYSTLRQNTWILYSSGIDENNSKTTIAAIKNFDVNSMIQLTVENSSLLDDFTAGKKMNIKDLANKLKVSGYFNSPVNFDSTITDELFASDGITRINCARFLWNLYVNKKGKKRLLTRYSTKYSQDINVVSPIADVDVSNVDFDSVMGVVESEIMTLPDGIHFFPERKITAIDYIDYLKFADK